MSACTFKENIDLIQQHIGGTYANMLLDQYNEIEKELHFRKAQIQVLNEEIVQLNKRKCSYCVSLEELDDIGRQAQTKVGDEPATK
jgi:glutaredoxin